jgi:hypothetical protein
VDLEKLEAYQRARRQRLSAITQKLETDDRIVAAWLTGSLGRGGGDAMSDLDLNIVISPEATSALCAHPWRTAGKTTPAREAFIRQFGTPTIIHDNHNNAPPHGCFTLVFYAEDHQEVDWIWLPQEHAIRPFDTLLLFEKQPIPVAPPQTEAASLIVDEMSNAVAYFWLMAAAGVKFIVRQQPWRANEQIQVMNSVLHSIKTMLAGQKRPFSPLPLYNTSAEQKAAIWQLGQQMQTLKVEIRGKGADFPEQAIDTVAARLALVN